MKIFIVLYYTEKRVKKNISCIYVNWLVNVLDILGAILRWGDNVLVLAG
jgi:hypothetical protein